MKKTADGTKVKRFRFSVYGLVSVIVLGIYSFTVLFLLAWALITSFKSDLDFGTIRDGNIFGFPKTWEFSNYVTAFESVVENISTPTGTVGVTIVGMFGNSLLYAGVGTLVFCLTRMFVAYACARYNFVGRKVIYTTVVVTLIIPIIGSLASELQMAHALGIYDTVWGLWIMKAGFTGMPFLIFHASFSAIPETYAEAARIDGAGHFSVLFRIMLPLVVPTFVAVYITNFIVFWNEYTTQMVFAPSLPTLAYGLYHFQFKGGAMSTPVYLAACVIVCIPIVIVFIAFRNIIMNNVAIGGIKG